MNEIGFGAAACTTLSLVPQLIKIRAQGGRRLAYPMPAIYLAGLVRWLVYGLMIQAGLIAANAASMVLVGSTRVMWARTKARRASDAGDEGSC